MAYFTAPATPKRHPKDIMSLPRRRRWYLAIEFACEAIAYLALFVLMLPFLAVQGALEELRGRRIQRKFRKDAIARANRERQ
jgi:hypothetical protein